MKKVIKIFVFSGLLAIGGISITSCSLDPTLTNTVDNEKTGITDAGTMKASLYGVFSRMVVAPYYGRDMIIFSEARTNYAYSDGNSGRFRNVSSGTVTSTAAYPKDTWAAVYKVISEANRVIAAEIEESKEVNDYRGQALVLRALAHYDLLRMYGQQYVDGNGLNGAGIPYIKVFAETSTDLPRGTVKENMEEIFADLNAGIALLKDNGSTSKVAINYAGALALKARIALFFAGFDASKYKDVSEASLASYEFATGSPLNVGVMPRSGFLDSYKTESVASNSIFELAQSGTDNLMTNSLRNIYFRGVNQGGYGDMRWNENTDVEKYWGSKDTTKEDFDIRKEVLSIQWDGSLANSGKFTASSSNIKMIRIEEVMFNYIEAYLEGGQGSGAKALEFFNAIVGERITVRDAGTAVTPVAITYTAADMTSMYRDQRTKELMFEGFGFEDIARWKGSYANPMSETNEELTDGVIKWDSYLSVFPLPQAQIDSSTLPQNKGY